MEDGRLYKMKNVFWCKNCINMSTRPRISFNEKGFCNACQWTEEKKILDWTKRKSELNKIIQEQKNKKNIYDCIVPVSGGKDGSYVAFKLRDEYGLNVLTVTSRPPLESKEGKTNLTKFVNAGFDHVHISPNSEAMKKFNKIGFIKKGSPYYGWLISIFTVVVKVAIQNNISLIFYGEDGEIEYGGSTKNKNIPFFDVNYIVKNYFEGDYFDILKETNLDKKKLFWFEIDKKKIDITNLKLTHWGYFEPWDSYRNYLFAKEKYKLEESESANEGTFTNFAQNDQALFALHMYLMYLKFGFGRATQDAGIEIRRGAMNRDQAINLAKLYDNSYPEKFIDLYLDYYEMTINEFNDVIDKFANKNLFKKVSGKWQPKFSIK